MCRTKFDWGRELHLVVRQKILKGELGLSEVGGDWRGAFEN
jgi:hypothetical protein